MIAWMASQPAWVWALWIGSLLVGLWLGLLWDVRKTRRRAMETAIRLDEARTAHGAALEALVHEARVHGALRTQRQEVLEAAIGAAKLASLDALNKP